MSDGLVAVQARVAQLRSMLGVDPAPSVTSTTTGSGGSSFAGALQTALSGTGTAGATDGTNSINGAANSDLGSRAVALAAGYNGVPYLWGGTDPKTGLDCSGLVQLVYSKLGVTLPRVAADQSRNGTAVASLADAKPGDLVFFGTPAHHVGIYVGEGQMIDAPHAGSTVGIHKLWGTPSAIRRPVLDATAAGATSGANNGVGVAAYSDLFRSAGATYGVDPSLLSAMAKTESNYNPGAISSAGAQGLMQLMPGTARELGVNAFDPAQAVDGAARMMRNLLQQFDGRTDLAVAAYNAGPGAVKRYGGIPPYHETQSYVSKVLTAQEGLR